MSEWITDRRPTEADATDTGHVWISDYKMTDFVAMKNWQSVGDLPWQPISKPSKYTPPERQFADGATYSNQKLWVDSMGFIWRGPISPESNLHFAKCEGICKSDGSLIWVSRHSELPDDCVLYVACQTPEPDTSLAASIERMSDYVSETDGATEYWQSKQYDDDLDRILEAARQYADATAAMDQAINERDEALAKCEELMSKVEGKSDNDPDCVGEGWRLLTDSEMIADGDEYWHHHKREWLPSKCVGQSSHSKSRWQYRRRIDADKPRDQTLIGITPSELSRLRGIEQQWKIQQVTKYDPTWVSRLIDLCEELVAPLRDHGQLSMSAGRWIAAHLAERGER